MKEASNMTRTTETTGADATTAFVGWYANDRYGSSSPENIDKAGAALNHMATGGAAGMNQLQDHQQRFLNSGNYTWGDGKAQAGATIDATRSVVGGGMGNIQGQVMPGVNAASERAGGIGPGDFGGHPADNHNPFDSLEPPFYFPAKIRGVNLDTIIGTNPATYNLLSHILPISLIS